MGKHERQKHVGLDALRHAPSACSCQKLRAASRAVTTMYNDYLRPTGLTIGQYSVLAALYDVSSLPLQKLAIRLGADRTTLTRSLARLEEGRLISIALASEDARVHMIAITDGGLERLIAAHPFWTRAQEALQEALGERGLNGLCKSLDGTIAALVEN